MTERALGLIAGSGQFPLWVTRAAKTQGHTVHAIGLRDWADQSLEQLADTCAWVRLGELKQLLRELKHHQVTTVTVAGKVTKEAILKSLHTLDPEMLKVVGRLRGDMRVNSLLGALAQRLADEGIALTDAAQFLQTWLPASGILTRRKPTEQEWQDIRLGETIARALAAHDVGQTVVVKRGVVLAVEAAEATDATIARGATYGSGDVIVVKMARPNQDMRFDVPVVGLDTIEQLQQARAVCLAVEAGKTLLLEREQLIARADEARIALVAL
jgi:UDP-2,3-diacylglucosamine hydrolase